jgi:S-adenosylmethionine:tRNA ribosyltransferase-isomerase
MNVSDFDFDLPDALIAQDPPAERGGSRLLVLRRDPATIDHSVFSRLGDYLRAGDLLVVNDTRVFPARLLGHRLPSGGAVECLLVRQSGAGEWEALMHPGQKLKPGAAVLFERNGIRLYGEVIARHFHGRRTIRLWTEGAAAGDTPADVTGRVNDAIERIGHIPLPPYIKRDDRPDDRERYQTVYARARGSIAAPTVGLHFTPAMLQALDARGVERTAVTLHVGYGTFKPVRVEQVEAHSVDPETYAVPAEAAAAITRALRQRRRIIAVGTTTARALESLPLDADGGVSPVAGEARLFIYPGHRFQIVSGLITNFHLPRSSLLMLVAALAGVEQTLAAYREAVRQGYRFYSYGDAMLVV